jgi:hypothetical protein
MYLGDDGNLSHPSPLRDPYTSFRTTEWGFHPFQAPIYHMLALTVEIRLFFTLFLLPAVQTFRSSR